MDIDNTRDEIARLSELARAAFGKRFQFCTVTIWGPQYRGRSAAVEVRLHIQGDPKGAFSAASAAEAIADAERFILEHAPAAVEAAGWAILGVVRA